MNNPKISVIIPVYNVEQYLAECLDSIVNQTLKEIEIICVNDGSTDNSLQILKEYASKDDRIKIIDEENQGPGWGRKVGLDVAQGEYILFCDADDKYETDDSFEKLFYKAQKLNTDILFFGMNIVFDDCVQSLPITIAYNPEKEIFTCKDILDIYTTQVALYCKIYKSTFLKKYTDWYFPKKIYLYVDAPFHRQTLLRANRISLYPVCCYQYKRTNSTSLVCTKFSVRKIEGYKISLKTEYEILKKENLFEEYKESLALYILRTAYDFFIREFENPVLVQHLKIVLEEYKILLDSIVKNNLLNNNEIIFFYTTLMSFDYDSFVVEFHKEHYLQTKQQIQKLQQQIQMQKLQLKYLKNSKSYRIGRCIVAPLSIPIKVFRLLRDYNLLKKSDLFDSEYYLNNNEDVRKAKVNPIMHYLRFGWKEGRNPSADFDSRAYLSQRPDVKVAGVCPLVHYLKFGKKD